MQNLIEHDRNDDIDANGDEQHVQLVCREIFVPL